VQDNAMNELNVTPAAVPNAMILTDALSSTDTLRTTVVELDNPVLAQAHSTAPIDAWETVAFPDAIVDVTQLPEAASIDIVTSLEQQNHTLRDRVTYLETSLNSAQSRLCEEVARWESLALQGDEKLQGQLQAQEQTIGEYVNELTASQQKTTELFAKLEQAHQAAQRQQIIMETLNTQHRNSQERVAQLERECANVHQQNVDQLQQLSQQSHQVRDLQSRLQRQQRYTLQYKAALEKSLEVATTATTPTLLSETTAQQLATQPSNMPKPTPVKPWSAPASETPDDQKAWLNSFLSQSAEFPTDYVLANFDWQPSQPIESSQVSFNLDELPENEAMTDGRSKTIDLDPAQINPTAPRLDGWENAPIGSSPFITLQANSELEAADSAPVAPAPKRDSLAAVDLPMFSPAQR
jgi:myosin heavy subunit